MAIAEASFESRGKSGKQPSASQAFGLLSVPPSTPVPQDPPTPLPPPLQPLPDDGDESVLAAAAYHLMNTDSLSDNEEGLAEHGAIPSRSEQSQNMSGSPPSKPKTSVLPYLPVPHPPPLACACASILTDGATILSPHNLPPVTKIVVTLRASTITNMASVPLFIHPPSPQPLRM